MMFGNAGIFGNALIAYTFTFDGNVVARTNVKTGSTPNWTLGASSYNQLNTPAHTYVASEGNGLITSPDGFTGWTTLNMSGCNLVTLDLTEFTNLAVLDFNDNLNLASVVLGTNTAVISRIRFYNVNSALTLDFSGFTNFAGTFDVWNVASVTIPSSSQIVTLFQLYQSGQTSLDISGLSNLKASVYIWQNSSLTTISFPTSAQVITLLWCMSNNLTGVIDISGLTALAGDIEFHSNPNMTGLIMPTSSGITTVLRAYSCNLTGAFSCAGMSGLGGLISLSGNPNLTSITWPTSSQTITYLEVTSTGISALTISTLTGLRGILNAVSCTSLTSASLPSTTGTFSGVDMSGCNLGYVDFTPMVNMTEVNGHALKLQNNGMTAAEVNQILVDLDSMSTGSFTGRSINIAGTNAAPDGSSGGYDGTTSKANLIAKGFTVTTN